MRRVVIMGSPGSGKSTLARELGKRLGLPVYHLDQAFWQPGWVNTPAEVFLAEVERLAALPEWVIEGNYTFTLRPRLAAADTVVYLDVPTWVCLARVLKRVACSYGHVRPDSAPGCPERWDWGFLRFTWSWNRLRRARNLRTAAGFPGRQVVLRREADRTRFLETLARVAPEADAASYGGGRMTA